MNYLLRTHEGRWGAPEELMLFKDEDGRSGEEHLTTYLRHLILLNEYSEPGPLIKRLTKRYHDDSEGELELYHVKTLPEGEGDDHYYEVRFPGIRGEGAIVARFTVRI